MKMLDLYNDEDHDTPHEKHPINHRAKIDLDALNGVSRIRDRIKAVLLRSEA